MSAVRRPAGRVAMVLVIVALVLGHRRGEAAGVRLRDVDWPAVLAADPHIRIDETVAGPFGFPAPGPYIAVDGPGMVLSTVPGRPPQMRPDAAIAGFAALDAVQYGDLDGDGVEEALIRTVSGGTSLSFGALLFRAGVDRPELMAVLEGYKFGAAIGDGVLAATTPQYIGVEPNCCPSVSVVATFILQDGVLVLLAESVTLDERAVTWPEVAVTAYYRMLGQAVREPVPESAAQRLAQAYELLSPAFRAAHPYDPWAVGFATTEHIDVQVRSQSLGATIEVAIIATERQPDGVTMTRRFTGTWQVVFDHHEHRWLLDEADIDEAP